MMSLSTLALEKLYQVLPEAFTLDDIDETCEPPPGYGVPKWAFFDYANYHIRSHPKLIETVKEIGLDKAQEGRCKLGIRILPVGYDYTIHEYDGSERVDPRFPYEKVIEDLKEYYLTGSKDFKCSLTKRVISGEIQLKHDHQGGCSHG